ncbi:MAG: divalent-cation tolerance protein CutA [Wenzhouxiangella sp.]
MNSQPAAPRMVLVQTTVESVGQAERLATELVNSRLAACVSIGSEVRSIYPWQGRVETACEVPLLIKSCPEQLAALKTALADLHPYDVPELLVLEVADGSPAYLEWARTWMTE